MDMWKIVDDWHVWFAWFAWHPVFLDNGKLVWLKNVNRRTTFHYVKYPTYHTGFYNFQYKEV